MTIDNMDFALPADLVIQEITTQISGRIPVQNVRNNYLEIFKAGVNAAELSAQNDDSFDYDSDDLIEQDTDKVYTTVVHHLNHDCGIMLNVEGVGLNLQLIELLYDLYVVRFHNMIISYITKYLMDNRVELANQYSDEDMSNMSLKSARKTFKNKADIISAVYMPQMIGTIIGSASAIHPETMITALHDMWPDDYLYSTVFNLFNTSYLSYDVKKYIEYVQSMYSDPISMSALTLSVSEKLIPTFKRRDQ